MIHAGLGWMHRFIVGMLSKEKSLATGILLALIVWTLTRLVDVVTGSLTIEYAVRYAPAILATGHAGEEIKVTLTDLSNDAAVSNVQVVIAGPPDMQFTDQQSDATCEFQAPSWGDSPTCDPHKDGIAFTAPMLIPGKSVVIGTRYTLAPNSSSKPIVRIKPGDETKFRLVEPGVRTIIARHETALLLTLLGVSIVVFLISVAAGISTAHK